VIQRLGELLIGDDPRPVERHSARLYAVTRQAPYGVNQQAIAAIENALVDIKAKSLGIPVYELLGGPIRQRIPLYWSHCGTYRVGNGDRFKAMTGCDPIRSLADVERMGAGGGAARLQGPEDQHLPLRLDRPRVMHMPGFMWEPGAGAEHRQTTWCAGW
jgi:galactonate dehydratase